MQINENVQINNSHKEQLSWAKEAWELVQFRTKLVSSGISPSKVSKAIREDSKYQGFSRSKVDALLLVADFFFELKLKFPELLPEAINELRDGASLNALRRLRKIAPSLSEHLLKEASRKIGAGRFGVQDIELIEEKVETLIDRVGTARNKTKATERQVLNAARPDEFASMLSVCESIKDGYVLLPGERLRQIRLPRPINSQGIEVFALNIISKHKDENTLKKDVHTWFRVWGVCKYQVEESGILDLASVNLIQDQLGLDHCTVFIPGKVSAAGRTWLKNATGHSLKNELDEALKTHDLIEIEVEELPKEIANCNILSSRFKSKSALKLLYRDKKDMDLSTQLLQQLVASLLLK